MKLCWIPIMLLLTRQNFVQVQCQYQIEKSIKEQHENSSYYEVLVVWRTRMDVRIHVTVQMDKLEKKKIYVWNWKRINRALKIIIVLFLLDIGIEKINETWFCFHRALICWKIQEGNHLTAKRFRELVKVVLRVWKAQSATGKSSRQRWKPGRWYWSWAAWGLHQAERRGDAGVLEGGCYLRVKGRGLEHFCSRAEDRRIIS